MASADANCAAGSDENVVRVERPSDGIAVVVLDRPTRMNAISPSTMPIVVASLSSLAEEDATRVVVVTGAGRGFCTGMDLGAIDEMAPREFDATVEWMRGMHGCSLAISGLPQPTIAAVNGSAIGGGFGIALGCDIRIAAPAARFGATFVRMAMGPDCGLSHTLAKHVGHARALEMLLTGDLIDADDALRLGVVSRVADDALAEALVLAERVAVVPAHASRKIKATLRRAADADLHTTLYDIEPAAQAELICHPDFFVNAAGWLGGHN